MGFTAGQMGAAGLIGQIGGAASSAFGSYFSTATQNANLSGQAAVADVNARIAELGAQSALVQGQQQIAALTMKAGQIKGSQRAALAANGIGMDSKSAIELQASTDLMKEIDRNTLETNALKNALGYRAQSMNFQNEALVKRASKGSPFGAFATSLLGSAGSVATSWYKLGNAGALDELKANFSADPIYTLGSARGWWDK